jgi:protocatechuate 3,4-dioxygenase beta subunit
VTTDARAGVLLEALFGVPLAPGDVADLVRPAAPLPVSLRRTDLLGATGAYGLRPGGIPTWPRWVGVAHVQDDERTQGAKAEDTLEPVATGVRGRVAQSDGSPVRGAEVILYSCFYLRQAYYDHRVREIGRAFTDEEGVFDLRPVDLDTVHFGRDGEVLVTVRHARLPDVVAQRLDGLDPGRESDVGTLVLPEEGAVVFGQVRDLQGRPVQGAVVRASGMMNPVDYDKTERMVVLLACPSTITDAEGRYRLEDLAPGVHEVSVHVRLDCVIHERRTWQGEGEWNPRVRTGHDVRGRVVDPDGRGVAAAVVRGGGNWTPTNPDGTFWLDNVDPGPLAIDVSHHAWRRRTFPAVSTDGADVTLALQEPLPRVTIEVVDPEARPVTLVEIAWLWAPGRFADEFTPDSPHWHDPRGLFDVTLPEGAAGLVLSREGYLSFGLPVADLVDGAHVRVALVVPPGPEAGR